MRSPPGRARLLPVLRTRDSPFSYRCNGCNRCCYDKRIRLNPYELARLARNRGMGTTELIARHTLGGTELRTRADGSCVFLGDEGCTVHPDRPLACRLYPLGRVGGSDGTELFVELEPHPRTAGCYGTDGTVSSYLEQQEVAPYFQAAERYRVLLSRMLGALQAGPEAPPTLAETLAQADTPGASTADGKASDPHVAGPNATDPDAAALLDVDRVVSDHCRRLDRPLPRTAAEATELHIEAVEAWLAALKP